MAIPRYDGPPRSPHRPAAKPLRIEASATDTYPADSFKPIASPRRAGPTRSIFISTVIDQVSPWLTPSNAFAATIHDHVGAQPMMIGTGIASSHPRMSVARRLVRPLSQPAARLESA